MSSSTQDSSSSFAAAAPDPAGLDRQGCDEGEIRRGGHGHGGHGHGGHGHGIAGGHGHGGPVGNHNRAFALGVLLNVLFVAVEAGFGFVSGSLALLADAGHNLSDVLGLLLAWGASILAQRRSSEVHTFGLKKTTILAALFNGLLLLIAVGGIAWEAVRRFSEPSPVAGSTVITVAAIGFVINAATMLLFMKGRKGDLNIRGAFLHMAADAGVSLGVAVAGLLIWWTGALWVDPVVSLLIATVIFVGTWSLLKDSINLAVDAVPPGIDLQRIRHTLQDLPGVISVHDLHVWGMSTTETALTAHLVRPHARDDEDTLIEQANRLLTSQYGICHVTLQIERGTERCPTEADCSPAA